MKNFEFIIIFFTFMLIKPIINGFVFFQLWAWFIVPIFKIEPVRFIEAITIMLLLNYLKPPINLKNLDEDLSDEVTIRFITLLVFAFYTLLIGAILTLFM